VISGIAAVNRTRSAAIPPSLSGVPDRPLSGLVVPIPEAEPAVGALREHLDRNAAVGVPAHVTALFPFVPPEAIDAAVLSRVEEVVAAVPGFGYAFSRTAWFDDAVLWLAPDDPLPFRALTARLTSAFPAHRPYEGAHGDDVVPHLTVGHGHPREVLAAAEREVTGRLPVAGRASGVVLLVQDGPGGAWSRSATFPLPG
jgi:2'-5' RNA ligase